MIEIFYNPQTTFTKNIAVSIDSLNASFVIENDKIIIHDSCSIGLHVLRIQQLDNESRLEILNVKINGVSVRQTLYFGWIEQEDKKLQPATVLWEKTQIWVFPFLNPVSHWIGLLSEKLYLNSFGKNLFDLYKIYIPESIEINNKYPKGLQDFFKYNFNCTIVPKDCYQSKDIPFELYDIDIDTASVYNEIYQNLSYLKSISDTYYQYDYNILEDSSLNTDNCWFNTKLFRNIDGENFYKVEIDKLPLTYNFVNSLAIDYSKIAITVLPPGGYLYPHVDRRPENAPEKYKGCKELYIPLNYPKGAAIKLQNVGILPNTPVVMNNQYFAHAVVNDSNQTRIVLTVSFDYNHEN